MLNPRNQVHSLSLSSKSPFRSRSVSVDTVCQSAAFPIFFLLFWLYESQEKRRHGRGLFYLPRSSASLRTNSVISFPTRTSSEMNSLVVTRETPDMTAETCKR